MYTSGRSYSEKHPQGKRRLKDGEPLAPRTMRKLGKKYLSQCSVEELKKHSKM